MKTSQFNVTNNNRANKLNHSITKRTGHANVLLDFETYSFVQVVENFFDLKPDVVEHMVFILKRLKSDYHMLCMHATIENMVLASALYAMSCSPLPCYDDMCIDAIVNCLYTPAARKSEITQIYGLYQNLKDIFYDSNEEILPYVPDVNPYTVPCY
jgi:hypothetical protein